MARSKLASALWADVKSSRIADLACIGRITSAVKRESPLAAHPNESIDAGTEGVKRATPGLWQLSDSVHP
jgi:hypothetical protein